METIRRWIDESDVYMLILGGRYGTIDQKTALSYTELEYDYAVSKNKPFFAVVITNNALDAKVKSEGKDVLEGEYPKELKAFREKALSKISSFFSDTKDIKLAVHETLADFQQRHEFTGWIPGNEGVDPTPLLEEIRSLQKERDDLKKQLSIVKVNSENSLKKSTSKWPEDELHEALSALREMEVSTKIFNTEGNEAATRYPVDRLFDAMRDSLISGVTNRINSSDQENLLYFNVCPKLEMHELAALEKVAGVAWQRYRLTAKGKAALVLLDKQKQKHKQSNPARLTNNSADNPTM